MSKLRVLFICTANSARSQMAEGLLRGLAGNRFEVLSAGTNPSSVNPNAIAAMSEVGIDISAHRSKSAEAFAGEPFDYVVTVCDSARESCPFFAGGRNRLHHSFEDPANAPADLQRERFRAVRDEIRRWLETEFIPRATADQ